MNMEQAARPKQAKKMISLRSRVYLSIAIGLAFIVTMVSVYYYSFRQMAIHQIHNLFMSVTGEVESHIHNSLSSIEDAARVAGYSIVVQRALMSASPTERLQSRSAAYDAMNNAKAFQNGILEIMAYVDTHNNLYTGTQNVHSTSTRLAMFRDMINSQDLSMPDTGLAPFYSEIYIEPTQSSRYFFYYLPIRNALPGALERQNAAAVLVMCDISRLMTLPLRGNTEAGIFALISDATIHYASDALSGALKSTLLETPSGNASRTVDGKNMLIYAFNIEKTGWKIVFAIAENSLVGDLFASRNLFFFFLLIGTVIVLLGILSSLITLSRSIFSVVQDVQSLSGGGRTAPVRSTRVREVSLLATQINQMLGRVETLHEARRQSHSRAYHAIIAQQHAEMIAYRSQINPHFLFNTLECIRSMAHFYKAGDLEELIRSTSRLLEYSLYAESIVPFSQELGQLENYMRVISIRYPSRYEFRMHLTDEAVNHPILSMTLQPLAENAVLHGIGAPRRRSPLIVSIKAWVDEGGVLFVRIADNGVGIPENTLRMLNLHSNVHDATRQLKKTSIGIDNIYSRLKMVDSRCSLTLYSRKGHYTVSELRIPPDIRLNTPSQDAFAENAPCRTPQD